MCTLSGTLAIDPSIIFFEVILEKLIVGALYLVIYYTIVGERTYVRGNGIWKVVNEDGEQKGAQDTAPWDT